MEPWNPQVVQDGWSIGYKSEVTTNETADRSTKMTKNFYGKLKRLEGSLKQWEIMKIF